MAIYVLLQCCKCSKSKKLHLFSYTKNKYGVSIKLCEHFNVIYSYTCKYKFFSLGWNIILEVKVQCRKCSQNYFNFGKNTFNSEFYSIDYKHQCCYNVFIMSVDGNKFLSDGEGFILQAKLKEQEEKLKIEHDKKRKREEEKQLDILFKNDLNYIDEELNQLLIKEDNKISIDLNLDIIEEIDKKLNFTFSKVSFS